MRSVTEWYKRPIEYYLGSKRRMLSYKNVRLKVADTTKKRADEARRLEELRQRQAEYARKQNREREPSGVRRGSGGWQTLREVVANIRVGRKSVYIVGSLA
jgi:hypothetical protein